MNRSKQKGTAWETAVVNYLRERGHIHVERRAMNGALDRGDIAGIPGLVLECKAHKEIDLGGFMNELAIEKRNDGAGLGVCIVKRRQKDVAQSYAVLTVEDFVTLLVEASA